MIADNFSHVSLNGSNKQSPKENIKQKKKPDLFRPLQENLKKALLPTFGNKTQKITYSKS